MLWGICFAASGRAIDRGVPPPVFFMLFALVAQAMGLTTPFVTGSVGTLPQLGRTLGGDLVWRIVAVITSCFGYLLIDLAIGEKNATVASLIEISYPLFVAFFAWLFFREAQVNRLTLVGAALIPSGVAFVYLANRR